MSISGIGYSYTDADVKDTASNILLAKQVADYAGTDLGTPDTFGALPHLAEFTPAFSTSKRELEKYNTDKVLLGTTEEAEWDFSILSRRKAIVQDLKTATENNIYLFLLEESDVAINGKYIMTGFLGEVYEFPVPGKDPKKKFKIKGSPATADVTIDVSTVGAGPLALLAATPPASSNLTIPKGQFFGMLEIDWP